MSILYILKNMYVFDGKLQGFGGRLVVITFISTLTDTVDIKTSKDDLQSGSATSAQSPVVWTGRRSDASMGGGGGGGVLI